MYIYHIKTLKPTPWLKCQIGNDENILEMMASSLINLITYQFWAFLSFCLEYLSLFGNNPTLIMTKISLYHEYSQSFINIEVAIQWKICTGISTKIIITNYRLLQVCTDGHTIIWVIHSMTEQIVFVETVASLLLTLSATPNKLWKLRSVAQSTMGSMCPTLCSNRCRSRFMLERKASFLWYW